MQLNAHVFPALLSGNGSLNAKCRLWYEHNQAGCVHSAAAAQPAAIGDVVILFATGEGRTTPAGADGALSGNPSPAPVLPVVVTIGGQQANLLYAGEGPHEMPGVLQMNAQVPHGITPGTERAGGAAGSISPVTIAVK